MSSIRRRAAGGNVKKVCICGSTSPPTSKLAEQIAKSLRQDGTTVRTLWFEEVKLRKFNDGDNDVQVEIEPKDDTKALKRALDGFQTLVVLSQTGKFKDAEEKDEQRTLIDDALESGVKFVVLTSVSGRVRDERLKRHCLNALSPGTKENGNKEMCKLAVLQLAPCMQDLIRLQTSAIRRGFFFLPRRMRYVKVNWIDEEDPAIASSASLIASQAGDLEGSWAIGGPQELNGRELAAILTRELGYTVRFAGLPGWILGIIGWAFGIDAAEIQSLVGVNQFTNSNEKEMDVSNLSSDKGVHSLLEMKPANTFAEFVASQSEDLKPLPSIYEEPMFEIAFIVTVALVYLVYQLSTKNLVRI